MNTANGPDKLNLLGQSAWRVDVLVVKMAVP